MIQNMKHLRLIDMVTYSLTVGLILIPVNGLAQEEEKDDLEDGLENIGERFEKWGEEMEEWGEQVEQSVKEGKPIMPIPPILFSENQKGYKSSPRFGLYLDDLDFEDVYEMHYPENYGVLIDGVIRGRNGDRAGLREGDIIMEFDGEKVLYEDHLLRMRNSKHVGDTAEIKYFRDEKVMTTILTFYPPEELLGKDAEISDKKKKLSPGYGGGSFEPVYIDFDFAGINSYLQNNGFGKAFDGNLIVLGGGGMGNVGNGLFIGGMGAGFSKREQIPVRGDINQIIGQKRYQLDFAFGGVTVTKKFALFTKRLIFDMGVMLGGGGISLKVSQSDGDFSWEDKIGDANNYSVKYEKGFFAYHPSVGLLIRIKNWFGIHGSVGYFGTYAFDDKWTEKSFDFTVSGDSSGDSPAMPSGRSYSLGVWFGY